MDLNSPTPSASRTLITGAGLHALLVAEFTRARNPKCTSCVAPAPFWGTGMGDKVTWYMPTAGECAYGCRPLLANMWCRLISEYEIAAPAKDHVFHKKAGRKFAAPI